MVMPIDQEDLRRVITVPHRLDGVNAHVLHDQLEAVMDSTPKVVVIDMSDLAHISNAGLRVIVQAARKLQARDAKLVLCAPSSEVRSVFESSRLDRVIDIRP